MRGLFCDEKFQIFYKCKLNSILVRCVKRTFSFYTKRSFTKMSLLGIYLWLTEKEVSKFTPNNIWRWILQIVANYHQYFHNYDRSSTTTTTSCLWKMMHFYDRCRQVQVLIYNIKIQSSFYHSISIIWLSLCASWALWISQPAPFD